MNYSRKGVVLAILLMAVFTGAGIWMLAHSKPHTYPECEAEYVRALGDGDCKAHYDADRDRSADYWEDKAT